MVLYVDLKDLGLRGGDHYERVHPLDLEPIVLGGSTYDVLLPEGVTVAVDRVAGGFLVTISADAKVYGACARCLAEAMLELHAEQQEFAPSARDGWEESDLSAFIEDLVVDVSSLTREAVVLALPSQIVCSESCEGLCPRCGKDLNQGACGCPPGGTDERWSKLKDLTLGRGEGS